MKKNLIILLIIIINFAVYTPQSLTLKAAFDKEIEGKNSLLKLEKGKEYKIFEFKQDINGYNNFKVKIKIEDEFVWSDTYNIFEKPNIKNMGKTTVIYKTPDWDYSIKPLLRNFTRYVTILSDNLNSSNFKKIEADNGEIGYQSIYEDIQIYPQNVKKDLILYKDRSLKSEKESEIKENEPILPLEKNKKWYKVFTQNGKEGWIFNPFIKDFYVVWNKYKNNIRPEVFKAVEILDGGYDRPGYITDKGKVLKDIDVDKSIDPQLISLKQNINLFKDIELKEKKSEISAQNEIFIIKSFKDSTFIVKKEDLSYGFIKSSNINQALTPDLAKEFIIAKDGDLLNKPLKVFFNDKDLDYYIKGKLKEGEKVKILQIRDTWFYIKAKAGKGWIQRYMIKPNTLEKQIIRINSQVYKDIELKILDTQSYKLRQYKPVNNSLLFSSKIDNDIKILKRKPGWSLVLFSDLRKGWVEEENIILEGQVPLFVNYYPYKFFRTIYSWTGDGFLSGIIALLWISITVMISFFIIKLISSYITFIPSFLYLILMFLLTVIQNFSLLPSFLYSSPWGDSGFEVIYVFLAFMIFFYTFKTFKDKTYQQRCPNCKNWTGRVDETELLSVVTETTTTKYTDGSTSKSRSITKHYLDHCSCSNCEHNWDYERTEVY